MLPAPYHEAVRLARAGDHARALAALEEAARQTGGEPAVWMALGQARRDAGRAADALAAFDRALATGHPEPAEVRLARAVTLADDLRDDKAAQAELASILAAEPSRLRARMNLGNLLEQQGRKAEAIATYREAFAQDPAADPANAALRWVAYARMVVIDPPTRVDDPRLEQLKHGLAALGSDHANRIHLLFALGHSLERLGEVDAAFDAFALGNRSVLRVHGRGYRMRDEERMVAEVLASGPGPAAVQAGDATGPRPLFICGMFRSGSTLLEQMLATHPSVHAGGEFDWLPRLAFRRCAPFPAGVQALDADQLAALAAEYRTVLRDRFPECRNDDRVTDKRPDNFLLIGLIKQLFPTAKLLHTTRHPMDNGLSIYMQHMNPEVTPYANDLGEIGHQYGLYRRLMAHWHQHFPGDILDVSYERLVTEPLAVMAEINAFLALPPGGDALGFHRLGNTVKTASYWQVRQPLHGQALGRWRRYGRHLKPLADALAAAGVDGLN